MVVAAPGAEPGGPRLQGLAQQALHGTDVLGGGFFVGQRPLTHHIHAQGVVRHLHQIVQAARRDRQRIHVLRKALPVPADAFVQRSARDVLHTLHQLDQVILMPRALGGKAHAAVAHDQGGHTVVDAGGKALVPSHLPVVVGVDVHKTGGDPQARGVQCLPGRLVHMAHRHNAAAAHPHIRHTGGRAGAVNHGAVFNQAIEHLFFSNTGPVPCRSQCAKCPTGWPA